MYDTIIQVKHGGLALWTSRSGPVGSGWIKHGTRITLGWKLKRFFALAKRGRDKRVFSFTNTNGDFREWLQSQHGGCFNEALWYKISEKSWTFPWSWCVPVLHGGDSLSWRREVSARVSVPLLDHSVTSPKKKKPTVWNFLYCFSSAAEKVKHLGNLPRHPDAQSLFSSRFSFISPLFVVCSPHHRSLSFPQSPPPSSPSRPHPLTT